MMKNELARIGQLVFDLSKASDLELVTKSNFLLLGAEYPRIRAVLSTIRERRPPGWSYALEFHDAEVGRLLQKLRIDRVYHELLQVYNGRLDELRRVYQLLEDILCQLAKRITLLRYAKKPYPERQDCC